MASFSLKKATKASCTRAILLPLRTRGLRLTPSGSDKPAPRRAAHPRLATVTRSRGGFDESTPTQGSATATTPRQALRPPPGHKRSDRGTRQAPTTLCAPPPYPPTTSLFGPSNSRHSPLFAHYFSLNYYKAINKDRKSPSCCPGSASLPPRQLAGFRCIFSHALEQLNFKRTKYIAFDSEACYS